MENECATSCGQINTLLLNMQNEIIVTCESFHLPEDGAHAEVPHIPLKQLKLFSESCVRFLISDLAYLEDEA